MTTSPNLPYYKYPPSVRYFLNSPARNLVETKPLSLQKLTSVSSEKKMPNLQRSCHPCTTAKRRCSRGTPLCARCERQGLQCRYVNFPAGAFLEEHCWQQETPLGEPSVERPDKAHHPGVTRTYDDKTLQRMRSILLGFAEEFKARKRTAFIHKQLERKDGPLRQAGSILRTPLDPKETRQAIRALIRHGQTQGDYITLLRHAQSAIILAIPLLLTHSSDPAIDTSALWALTHRLWEEAPCGLRPGDAWLVAESVRRTILVCNILLRTWMVQKQGYAVQSLCVEALPFEARTGLWEDEGDVGEESLVSVAEFVRMKGDERPASKFEELLLLAFKDTASPP